MNSCSDFSFPQRGSWNNSYLEDEFPKTDDGCSVDNSDSDDELERIPNALYKEGVYVICFDGPFGGHAAIAIDDKIEGFLCGVPSIEPDGLQNYLTRFDEGFKKRRYLDDDTTSSNTALAGLRNLPTPADLAFAPRSYNVTLCALKISKKQKETLKYLCANPKYRLGTCMNNVASLLQEAEIIQIPLLSSIAPSLGISYLEQQLEKGHPCINSIEIRGEELAIKRRRGNIIIPSFLIVVIPSLVAYTLCTVINQMLSESKEVPFWSSVVLFFYVTFATSQIVGSLSQADYERMMQRQVTDKKSV